MEFHKPKPVHSWREFLTEIGVVVIGVCIALTAEQAVEWWHWRSQVNEAREIIASELSYSVQSAITRLRAQPCIEGRLDEIARVLDSAAKSGSLPPRSALLTGGWDSVVSSQTATHFPRQQLAAISRVYKNITQLDQFYLVETDAWRNLYAIVGPGRHLDPTSETVLRKALSEARSTNRSLASLGAVTIRRIRDLNLTYNTDDLAAITRTVRMPLAGGKPDMNASNATRTICGSMGAVPPMYGQGQFSYLPSMISDAVKAIPDFTSSGR